MTSGNTSSKHIDIALDQRYFLDIARFVVAHAGDQVRATHHHKARDHHSDERVPVTLANRRFEASETIYLNNKNNNDDNITPKNILNVLSGLAEAHKNGKRCKWFAFNDLGTTKRNAEYEVTILNLHFQKLAGDYGFDGNEGQRQYGAFGRSKRRKVSNSRHVSINNNNNAPTSNHSNDNGYSTTEHETTANDSLYTVLKKTKHKQPTVLLSIDLDMLLNTNTTSSSKNKKRQPLLKAQILKELEFFDLSPSACKKNENLVLSYPALHVKLKRVSTHELEMSLSLEYSIKVYENFICTSLFTPDVILLLNDLMMGSSDVNGFQNISSSGSNNNAIQPMPTYYQLGYEFLNDWNPVGSSAMDGNKFEQYYGDIIKHKNLRLSSKIKHILQNINNPSGKLFYNLLTEYAAKFRLPPMINNTPPQLYDESEGEDGVDNKPGSKDSSNNHMHDTNKKNALNIPGLQTNLFNFQVETLLWCLDKENVDYDLGSNRVSNRPYFEMRLFCRLKSKRELSPPNSSPSGIDISNEHLFEYNYNYLSKKIDKVVFGWVRIGIDCSKSSTNYSYEVLNSNDFFEDLAPSKIYWFNKYTGSLISTFSLIKYMQENFQEVLPDYTKFSGDKELMGRDIGIKNGSCQLQNGSTLTMVHRPEYFAQNLLSEEMGLGKTIELLALILTNQRKDFKQVAVDDGSITASMIDDDNYVFDEVTSRYVLKLKTTLIICPDSILDQWIQEMNRFAPSLKIMKYDGYSQFYKKLAKLDKQKEKQKKSKPQKFVVKLKFNREKLLQTDDDDNRKKKFLVNYSTFGHKTSSDLKFTPLLDRANSNCLNSEPFKHLPNVQVKSINLQNETYTVPVIRGTDDRQQDEELHEDEDHIMIHDIEEKVHDVDQNEETLKEMLKKDLMKNIESSHRRVAFELSQYDIIVASYQVVTKELHYAQFNPNVRPTRAAARNANRINSTIKNSENNHDSSNDGIEHNGIVLSTNRHDYSSPLVLLQFWRIMLDEVQMVSSVISNAAKTCRIFSRCHSWGISGTPIKKDLNDIMSYFQFLRIVPFNNDQQQGAMSRKNYQSWNMLLQEKPASIDFLKLIMGLAIRHDKAMVKNDIRLPKQNRVLITSTFTAVEQDNYIAVFKEFLQEAGLNAEGGPVVEDWVPNPQVMRKYLTYLRKTCCHIDLGSKKVFRNNGVAMSMDDILKRFVEETKSKVNELEKENTALILEMGEIREQLKEPYQFKKVLRDNIHLVIDKIAVLENEIEADQKIKELAKKEKRIKLEDRTEEDGYKDKDGALEVEIFDDEDEDESKSTKKIVLRSWYGLLHKFYFFIANSHFQIAEIHRNTIKLPEEELLKILETYQDDNRDTKIKSSFSESDAFDDQLGDDSLQKYVKNKILENKYYKIAELLRDKMLISVSEKAIETITSYAPQKSKLKIKPLRVKSVAPPTLKKVDHRDLKLFYFKLITVVDELDTQAKQLNEWLTELSHILFSPLIAESNSDNNNDGRNDTGGGEEYDKTIVDQEKAFYLLSVLEVCFKYRDALLNGFNNTFSSNMSFGTGIIEQPIFDEDSIVDPKGKKNSKKNFNKSSNTAGSGGDGIGEVKNQTETETNEELELFKNHLKQTMQQIRPTICQEGASKEFCLKYIATQIKTIENDIGSSRLMSAEIEAIKNTKGKLDQVYNSEVKAFNEISKKHMHMLNVLFNTRASYFKQLQAISDTVQPTDFNKYPKNVEDISELPSVQFADQLKFIDEKIIQPRINYNKSSISKLHSRSLYLNSLRDTNTDDGGVNEEEKLCIICQSPIILGVLTECGHHYCKDCLDMWMNKNRHRNCPLCKAEINKNTVYEFTFTKQNLEVGLIFDEKKADEEDENSGANGKSRGGKKESKFLFYKPLDDKEFNTINEVSLKSRSKYGAKINTILKLVKWLKENQNVQIVVFSQWEDFLRIVATALQENDIKFLGVRKSNENVVGAGNTVNYNPFGIGFNNKKPKKSTVHKKMDISDINRFKYDSSITCFLLNAQQQAAGLTLVNATHVILCEPLVNTALELQAINRIHRIGQRYETTVWMVGIQGSIEESIINLSTKKRIDQLSKLKQNKDEINSHYLNLVGDMMSEDNREDNQLAVDSIDLMGETDKLIDKTGGEYVPVDELWESFFSKRGA